MNNRHGEPSLPHLVWVFAGPLAEVLDAATWLETTRELRKLGWRVTLVNQGPAGWLSIRGVETCCISAPDVFLVRKLVFHFKLLLLLLSGWSSIDLILFHQTSAPWILPLRMGRALTGADRPLLVMDTRTIPMTVATWKSKAWALFMCLMNRLANNWADGQTAITGRMAQSMHIPSQHLWGTWPSGVHPDQFAPAQKIRQWPLTGQPIQLIYVGVLYRERNLLALCRAVESVNRKGMSFVLSILGDGWQRSELAAVASQTQGRIRVLPPVAHEDIPALLGQAHVGVLPFPDEEMFRVSSPIKLFEYMAAGLPILATRIACHTDVVGEGAYVFWAEDDSVTSLSAALRQVWRTSASLSRMGSQAASAASFWTWAASAGKLSDALQRGLAPRSSAPQGVICE